MRRLLVLVAVALGVAGCGVPLDSEPRAAQPMATAAATPGGGATPGTATERICLVRDSQLAPVPRRVTTPLSADAHLRLLLDGPTRAERNEGYTSALTGATLVTGATQDGGLVTVETGSQELGRADDVLVFGQVVCTLSSRLPVGAVEFVHDGSRLRVPRGDGSLTAGPLTIADYAGLLATE
ncbi:GerMN domain-containing protein [Cryptosporangium arvum]|uniref:GerMN domain-containing protein n=1 Tax=Cryptosporangium arvum TaxID=80871 RepID=UPI0004BA184F|nr:GerMN domain-containing protein [Cryptosporangium arvum]